MLNYRKVRQNVGKYNENDHEDVINTKRLRIITTKLMQNDIKLF